MNLYFPAQSLANPSADPSGNWLMQSGRAVTLAPTAGGQLAVAQGQLWATLSEARTAWPRSARLARCATVQDYFLRAGDKLAVPFGAHLVIESTGGESAQPAAFAWQLSPQPAPFAVRARLAGVVQASGELGQALGAVMRALRHLLGAVLTGPRQAPSTRTCS